MNWKKIDVKTIDTNVFKMIGDEWMLITAKIRGASNTMTASWGGVGIMWGKPVATAYIRPQRYTRTGRGPRIHLRRFFGGKKMPWDIWARFPDDEADKITAAGLHVTEIDGAPSFEEASLVLVSKALCAGG